MTTSANAVSAFSADLDSFKPNVVRRYAPGDHDVTLKVLYCGYETAARRQHALLAPVRLWFSRTPLRFRQPAASARA